MLLSSRGTSFETVLFLIILMGTFTVLGGDRKDKADVEK
jgi:hypothetical protein